MEREPLREIDDIKTSSGNVDPKKDSMIKYEDKENVDDFILPCPRHSLLKHFDPLFESPVRLIKKEEQDVDSTFIVAETYAGDLSDGSTIKTSPSSDSENCCSTGECFLDLVDVEGTYFYAADSYNQDITIDGVSEADDSNYFSTQQINYEDINEICNNNETYANDIGQGTSDNEIPDRTELTRAKGTTDSHIENCVINGTLQVTNDQITSDNEILDRTELIRGKEKTDPFIENFVINGISEVTNDQITSDDEIHNQSVLIRDKESPTDFDAHTESLKIVDVEYSSASVADYILQHLIVNVSDTVGNKILVDMSATITLQEQEVSDLKLQLNQCQQVRATLELQLRQKEEIIIKSEAEFQRREAQYKLEIKQLKEKLDERKEDVKDDEVKKLKESVEKLKTQEKKLLDQLNNFTTDEDGFKQIMDEYEKAIGQQASETEKLKREHTTVKRNLSTLEIAFSDVLQKYDRSKIIIAGYKNNEEMMQQSLLSSNETIKKNEEKYDSLKAHAKAQIDKSNKEMNLAREKSQAEFHKLTAIIKRLEIKIASLVDALDQKTKECSALAALCDEVTGHVE